MSSQERLSVESDSPLVAPPEALGSVTPRKSSTAEPANFVTTPDDSADAHPNEHETTEAYERWLPPPRRMASAPVALSCEHASQRLPEPYSWSEADQRLVGTHWAFDLGARELTLALARHLKVPAVLSRFSRLLIDPNRSLDSETLFRKVAEGRPVELNTDLTDEEKERRLARYYRPYHESVARTVAAAEAAPVVFSLHTFTPLYEGAARSMEVGVLFDRAEALAHRMGAHMEAAGLVVAYNEPYSGKSGMMHAVESHATQAGREAVELEVRQDLCVDPEFRARLVPILAGLFA